MCLWRSWRRRRLLRQPIAAGWRAQLERLPFVAALPAALQQRFVDQLRIFIAEKHFVGAGGLVVDDAMRLLIAACAVRLTLHRDVGDYDRLTEIVIYPYDYRHPDQEGAVLGEARHWGTVVLSWPAVQRGLQNPSDGHETAGHEFAHVLDNRDGAFDGTPVLEQLDRYAPWARLMQHHFERLRRGDRAERKALRDYGATHPAEFFAVATESYFEKPRQLRQQTPELYAQLQRFYGGDPAADPALAPVNDARPRRNDPCPCGSGKKYKKCCGAGSR